MKVIDLYNKIANDPILLLPKKIKFEDKQYEYHLISGKYCRVDNPYETFEDDWYISKILNEEIEIIEAIDKKEDKKIEKVKMVVCDSDLIDRNHFVVEYLGELKHKINEIIDKINGE